MRNAADSLYIILLLVFLALTIFINEVYLLRACIGMAVTFLMLIIEAMNNITNKIVEQKKEDSRQLHQTLSAIGMDLLNALKK